MAKLEPKLRATILSSLCEGSGVRATARTLNVEPNTVLKLLADAGDMAIAYMASLEDLKVRRIQADELYAFIAAKEANVDDMDDPSEEAGTSWCYLAMCTETKLIFSYALGERNKPDATAFMKDVVRKLKRNSSGEFVTRPAIATDGLKAYQDAFQVAFGDYADYGMMVKFYEQGSGRQVRGRYVRQERRMVAGDPAEADIHTCYIERQNLNLRMGNRRFTRRSNGFSKTILNHERQLALWLIHHNFVHIPRPVRPPRDEHGKTACDENGKKLPWIKRLPAAMEAGLTDRIWTCHDLIALTDEFVVQRREAKRQAKRDAKAEARALRAKPNSNAVVRAAYWVYRSFIHHTTKVHATGCCNCRDGHGKKGGGKTKSGEWLPFDLLEDAKAAAALLAPDETSICNMCLGSYHSLGYLGPR